WELINFYAPNNWNYRKSRSKCHPCASLPSCWAKKPTRKKTASWRVRLETRARCALEHFLEPQDLPRIFDGARRFNPASGDFGSGSGFSISYQTPSIVFLIQPTPARSAALAVA